jgi:hypothetical protein
VRPHKLQVTHVPPRCTSHRRSETPVSVLPWRCHPELRRRLMMATDPTPDANACLIGPPPASPFALAPPPWTTLGEPPPTPLPPLTGPSPPPHTLAAVPHRPSPPAGRTATTVHLRPELPYSAGRELPAQGPAGRLPVLAGFGPKCTVHFIFFSSELFDSNSN